MAPYRTLMEMELLPMLYTDPAGLSSSIMTPITKRQADLLDTVSDDKKKDWEFTASTDSSLSNDMLCALDDDLSNNPAFSQLYLEYCTNVRKAYDKRLRNPDDKEDEHHNTYREAVVDHFAGSIVDCVLDTTMRLLPDCSPFHATLKPYSIIPTPVVVPDYTLFFRDRSLNAPSGRCHVLLGEDKGPLLLFPAASELITRIEAVGSIELDYPYDVSYWDNWWTLINKAALYMTHVDSCGADTLLYYSVNAFVIIRRQRNGPAEPDHLFIDLKGIFDQFRSIGNVGLQRVDRLFLQPDGGYQSYVHLHDMFLASSIITALASNSDYATDFPPLEHFRNQRRPQPAKKSDLYDVHGREHDMPLYSSQSPESDGSMHDPTYSLSQDSPATSASLSSRTRALSRATSIFNVLHGCGGVSMPANFYWRVQMHRRHSSCVCLAPSLHGQDIDIESSLGSSSDGDTYLVGVRGSNKKLVLKVFSFAAFGQAEFCAYMAMKDLQGSIIPVCYGFGYMSEEQPWILLEYIETLPSRASLSDLKRISRPHQGKVMHAVKVLHQLGYMHGDVFNNIVWTVDEDPVIIDLMRVRTHRCHGDSCLEIEDVRVYLGLTRRDADLWSMVVRSCRDQEPGMFVTGKPHNPNLRA